MKEPVTIRLYSQPDQAAVAHSTLRPGRYRPADDVKGWDYDAGDQIGLHEENGGYLMGRIEHIDRTPCEDEAGCYKIATVWTQD